MSTYDLRQRIKARLEEDQEGPVEIYELGPVGDDGRRSVTFYVHRGGESQRWRTHVRIGPHDEVTECEVPSLAP